MRRYFPRQRDGTFAGRSEEVVAPAGRRTGQPHRRSITISHYRAAQRCAAILPASGMEHSQDDPRRSLRPPDGGRDNLTGEVMRKKRHRPDPSGSKQELSRLAGSGGSVMRIGIVQGERLFDPARCRHSGRSSINSGAVLRIGIKARTPALFRTGVPLYISSRPYGCITNRSV